MPPGLVLTVLILAIALIALWLADSVKKSDQRTIYRTNAVMRKKSGRTILQSITACNNDPICYRVTCEVYEGEC